MGGVAPGRVREGGTPLAQVGGIGERCKLPYRGLGWSPRSQRFLHSKTPETTQKKKARPLKIKVEPRLYCLIVYNVRKRLVGGCWEF